MSHDPWSCSLSRAGNISPVYIAAKFTCTNAVKPENTSGLDNYLDLVEKTLLLIWKLQRPVIFDTFASPRTECESTFRRRPRSIQLCLLGSPMPQTKWKSAPFGDKVWEEIVLFVHKVFQGFPGTTRLLLIDAALINFFKPLSLKHHWNINKQWTEMKRKSIYPLLNSFKMH